MGVGAGIGAVDGGGRMGVLAAVCIATVDDVVEGGYIGASNCSIWYVGRITKSGGYPEGGPDDFRGRVGFYGNGDIRGGGYQGFGPVGCFYSEGVRGRRGNLAC